MAEISAQNIHVWNPEKHVPCQPCGTMAALCPNNDNTGMMLEQAQILEP